jgi:hypothetical protein
MPATSDLDLERTRERRPPPVGGAQQPLERVGVRTSEQNAQHPACDAGRQRPQGSTRQGECVPDTHRPERGEDGCDGRIEHRRFVTHERGKARHGPDRVGSDVGEGWQHNVTDADPRIAVVVVHRIVCSVGEDARIDVVRGTMHIAPPDIEERTNAQTSDRRHPGEPLRSRPAGESQQQGLGLVVRMMTEEDCDCARTPSLVLKRRVACIARRGLKPLARPHDPHREVDVNRTEALGKVRDLQRLSAVERSVAQPVRDVDEVECEVRSRAPNEDRERRRVRTTRTADDDDAADRDVSEVGEDARTDELGPRADRERPDGRRPALEAQRRTGALSRPGRSTARQ